MAYDIGPKIGIDGEDKFRKSLRQLTEEYKTMTAQTKAVTAEFEKNGDEQGKLRALATQLDNQIKKQQERQELLTKAVKASTDKYKENDEITQKWKRALYESQETVSKLQKELNDVKSALGDAGDEMEDFKDTAEDAGDATLEFGDVLKANLLSDAIFAGLSKLGDLVKDFAGGMLEEAATMRANMAQFSQTFGDLEAQATESLENLSKNVGIHSTRMQSSYTKIFAFAKTAGAESEVAMDLASRSMAVAADSAAYYDRSIEDVTETLQSFLKGSYANDAALGISCTETTRNAAANELYAKSFKDLSEAQKVDVLLSMVEAGNKASGAIGQAARESDSWENVMGELTNSWKLLQAKLGEPVLERTIPLIQKLTDALDEAGKSKAFAAIADGLSKSLGWILDNAGDIISATAGITAAIVAFKIATSASKWLDTLRTSMTALLASMQTHPLGLVVSAVAGLCTALSLLPDAASESAEQLDSLQISAQDCAESIECARVQFDSLRNNTEITAQTAEEYIETLERLEAQGLTSAQAQEEYSTTIGRLQALLPDINISINEQTGLLRGGTKALREQVTAWENLAYAEAYYDARKSTISGIIEAEAALRSLREAYEDLIDSNNRNPGNSADFMIQKFALELAINESEKAITKGNESLALYEDYAREAGIAVDGLGASTTAMGEAVEEAANTSIPEVKTSLADLIAQYSALRSAAEDSITKQIGLFEDLSAQSGQTFEEILAALESQQDAFRNYADNLTLAMERGIDKGLVQKLSDGSKESMQILNTLVNGTDEQIAALNESLGNVEEGRRRVATAAANIQMDWKNALAELQDSANGYGRYIVMGLADGIESEIPRFVSGIRKMGQAGQETFREIWSINSPSAVAADMAHWIPIGAAQGVEREIPTFQAAMERLYAVSDFRFPDFSNVGQRMLDYQGITTSNSVHVNLGGVQVSLSAPQGTDLYALANMVGDVINEKAIRRAIAYG